MNNALQVIESVYEDFKTGNIPGILEKISPEASWYQSSTLPWGGELKGPDGAGQFFQRMNETMETLGFEINENIERGDEVFSFGKYTARGRKSGKVGTSEFMFRWKVDGGKIVSYYSYVDSGAMLAAM